MFAPLHWHTSPEIRNIPGQQVPRAERDRNALETDLGHEVSRRGSYFHCAEGPLRPRSARGVYREESTVNNFKPLITIAVLGCIGYVVYTHLNSKPSAPPPGAPTGWDSAPTVQMPAENGLSGKWDGLGSGQNNPLPPAAMSRSASGPSGANSANTVAPSFATSAPSIGSQAETTGPTFGSAANSNPAPAASVTPTADDQWATTDPAAAASSSTPPPTANYGDRPAADPSVPNNDRYPSVPIDGQAPQGGAPNPPPGAEQQDVGKQFQAAWEKCSRLLEDGRLVEGLTELSSWHEHPRLSATENQQLTDLLDQVSGTVIYSTQHFTEPAHVVKDGERLQEIADQYSLPWQLLAKINGIEDPASLQSGEQLKVVRGPFGGVIQIEKRQLTLMLGNLYAGRFVIGIGRDLPPREGTFTVTEKVSNPVYHGRERTINADDPSNPLGERWIALGSDMGIHGVGPLTDIGSTNQPGSISLGQRDIDDVYDILSVGSKVMIVK